MQLRKNLTRILTLFAIIASTTTYAQDSTSVTQPTEVVSLNKIRLNLLGLTYEREQKIGKLTTVYAGAGVAATLLVEYDSNYFTGTSSSKTYFDLTPTVYGGFRQYYHFNSRVKKGKKTINNSSNYFGLDVSSYLGTLLDKVHTVDWEIGITPQWGIQRSVGRKVNFELSFGPTVRINEIETYYGVDARIGFSFLL